MIMSLRQQTLKAPNPPDKIKGEGTMHTVPTGS